MLFTDVIRSKRDGETLTAEQIEFFVNGLTDESIPAEQVSALAMAIFLRSMSIEEAGLLTTAMAHSGVTLDWSGLDLDGPIIDKHSTGGVGDKVSFLLAPIAAACGCYVPMISGRGLGHTGGTLDKIGSIPGYQATPDLDLFMRTVKTTGCAIIGQTADLAPADRRFYAIRDVTSTVESIPLITASILSKKIAAGLDGLVMDVKCGSGAFMTTVHRARELASSIINTANSSGLKTHALITDMNETLGRTAGNAVEIAESMAYLTDTDREERLDEVVMALCAEMLIVAGIQQSRDIARTRVNEAIVSGKAAEVFGQMVGALGGPNDFVERYEHYLPKAAVSVPVYSQVSGYLSRIDAFAVGNTIIELGGGRRRLYDQLDLTVGLTGIAAVGTTVDGQTPLAIVNAASAADAENAASLLRQACTVSDTEPAVRPVIYDTVLPSR